MIDCLLVVFSSTFILDYYVSFYSVHVYICYSENSLYTCSSNSFIIGVRKLNVFSLALFVYNLCIAVLVCCFFLYFQLVLSLFSLGQFRRFKQRVYGLIYVILKITLPNIKTILTYIFPPLSLYTALTDFF